jgi:hypothetical protein
MVSIRLIACVEYGRFSAYSSLAYILIMGIFALSQIFIQNRGFSLIETNIVSANFQTTVNFEFSLLLKRRFLAARGRLGGSNI